MGELTLCEGEVWIPGSGLLDAEYSWVLGKFSLQEAVQRPQGHLLNSQHAA